MFQMSEFLMDRFTIQGMDFRERAPESPQGQKPFLQALEGALKHVSSQPAQLRHAAPSPSRSSSSSEPGRRPSVPLGPSRTAVPGLA